MNMIPPGSMGPGDLLTIVLIGVVGSGKSCLATRLIGQDVFASKDQLPFPISCGPRGNDGLVWGEGYLLGREDLGRVRVGDFPGFRHARGPDFDIATVAEIAHVLGSEPVHAVVFVFDTNRLPACVVELFDAVLCKLDPSDYNKIHFVCNKYFLSEDSAQQRRLYLGHSLGREATDEDVKRQMVSGLLTSFRNWSNAEVWGPPSEEVQDLFVKATSFLNTNYLETTMPGKVEMGELAKFATKLKATYFTPINWEQAAENQTRGVHEGYRVAQEEVKRHKVEARQHMEELEQLKNGGDEIAGQNEEKIKAIEQQFTDANKRAEEAQFTLDLEAAEHEKAMMAKNDERRGPGGPIALVVDVICGVANALGV